MIQFNRGFAWPALTTGRARDSRKVAQLSVNEESNKPVLDHVLYRDWVAFRRERVNWTHQEQLTSRKVRLGTGEELHKLTYDVMKQFDEDRRIRFTKVIGNKSPKEGACSAS